MKRVLFISQATGWTGASINMINIINSLDKSKYTIKVLLLKDSSVSKILVENNIEYSVVQSRFYKYFYKFYNHTVPAKAESVYSKLVELLQQFRLILSWLLSRYYFVPNELKRHEYDIAHLNSVVLTDWLSPCKAKGRVIVHVQEPMAKGLLGIRYAFFRYIIKKNADSVIAISKDNACRINLDKITTVVYNFTDLATQNPSIKSYKSQKVLYVGGVARIKGFYQMIEALDYLEDGVAILLAGDFGPQNGIKYFKLVSPSYRKKLRALKKMRNCKNAIEIGQVENITHLLDEVCCLVSPFSVTHFSRPIIEAFANYKTVIATNVEGIDEVVKHDHNGFIVENRNPLALANAINFITRNDTIALRMGEEGFKDAIELYSSRNISEIEKIYDNN